MTDTAPRRTKRRYADELYPHPAEGETRPLTIDVPYLYARATGLNTGGTGWHGLFDPITDPPQGVRAQLALNRTDALIQARLIALAADALLQGMTGDDAWKWVNERADDESGEVVADRAEFYGVDWTKIKPYPCGDEPDYHNHLEPEHFAGGRYTTRKVGREADCPSCGEPDPDAQAAPTA